jgi:hypothetical protein
VGDASVVALGVADSVGLGAGGSDGVWDGIWDAGCEVSTESDCVGSGSGSAEESDLVGNPVGVGRLAVRLGRLAVRLGCWLVERVGSRVGRSSPPLAHDPMSMVAANASVTTRRRLRLLM